MTIESGEASGTAYTPIILFVILAGCLIVFVVSLLQEQGRDLESFYGRRHWLVKCVLFAALFLVLPALGQPSGEAGGFIYAQF